VADRETGNGTQQIFYHDDGVLYASLHQSPLYPATGAAREVGAGDGEGYTVNVPVPPGSGDAEYLAAVRDVVAPVAEQFQPQFVLISAGFDAHRDDPLASLRVTEAGFGAVASVVLDVAGRHADGRVIAVLEGGYHLDALARSAEVVVRAMAGEDAGTGASDGDPAVDGPATDIVTPVRQCHSKYWQF